MASAGVDVRAAIEQVLDHRRASPVRRFPKHRAAAGTGSRDPVRSFGEDRAHGVHIAATRSHHTNLQEVARLAGEQRHVLYLLRT